jgi:hypothetical protein
MSEPSMLNQNQFHFENGMSDQGDLMSGMTTGMMNTGGEDMNWGMWDDLIQSSVGPVANFGGEEVTGENKIFGIP